MFKFFILHFTFSNSAFIVTKDLQVCIALNNQNTRLSAVSHVLKTFRLFTPHVARSDV